MNEAIYFSQKIRPNGAHITMRGCNIHFAYYVLWRIGPLLCKDLEINNQTTADAMQQRDKHTSTTIVTVGIGVFYSVRAKWL
jgi:hypothetical protein